MTDNADHLRFRQIHLDFHTHESITGIGADFDADRFADTLQTAHVDSVNLFARCHHGYVYYHSADFADYQHPHLECDLLREQVAACHARDIRTPIYISVQLDAMNAARHPEWLCRTREGKVNIPVGMAGFYNHLCVNSPYRDWLKAFTGEVLRTVDGDGLWFDIVQPQDCFCESCLANMRERGIDPLDEPARHRFACDTILEFQREMTEHVNAIKPGQLVFYNSGHIGPAHRDALPAFSHLELESLPGGAWGYEHFPQTARYARTLGTDFLGMTGKFHTAWGDFHSFKTPESLRYECGMMLAMGGKCCVGDQLHPRGEICPTTYKLIGETYGYVESCEPYCRDVTPAADIAVFTPEAFAGLPLGKTPAERNPASGKGAARLLQELHQQFDMIDADADLSGYRVVILPDHIPADAALAAKLNGFIDSGRSLIVSHRSGLDKQDKFAIPVGAQYDGEQAHEPTFVIPRPALGAELPTTEHVMHQRGAKLTQLSDQAEVLADQAAPYFNRTWAHYCSHRHAPSSGEEAGPAVIDAGRVLYFAHPIFAQYHHNAPPWVRHMLRAALQRKLPEPTLSLRNAPTTLVATVNRQDHPHRSIVHLLHGVPVSNAQSMCTINDELPLSDLAVSLRVDGPVKRVTVQPANVELDFDMQPDCVTFTVPRVGLHTMVVVE